MHLFVAITCSLSEGRFFVPSLLPSLWVVIPILALAQHTAGGIISR